MKIPLSWDEDYLEELDIKEQKKKIHIKKQKQNKEEDVKAQNSNIKSIVKINWALYR